MNISTLYSAIEIKGLSVFKNLNDSLINLDAKPLFLHLSSINRVEILASFSSFFKITKPTSLQLS